MHPTSHRPLNCTHLEHASTWLIYQHKGLSCQALSPLPSSPRSSAGCIQGQLTDKRDLSEILLLALELLQKKTWNSHTVALGSPCYEASVNPFTQEQFSSWGSHPWAPTELHCSSIAAIAVPGHTPSMIRILTQPMNSPSWSEPHLALLLWTCLAGTEL